MTKETEMRLHRIYNLILSAFLILAGMALIAGCAYIYFEIGEYTREIVGKVLSYVGIFVGFTVLLILAGFVYELVSPLKAKKTKPERDYAHYLKTLYAKKDLSEVQKELVEGIAREKRLRKVWTAVSAALFAVCALGFLVYALDPENYSDTEINASVIAAMQIMAAPLLLSGICGVFIRVFKRRSMEREAELLKKIPDAKGAGLEVKGRSRAAQVILLAVKIAVVLCAAGLIAYGAWQGGFADVMTKAVNICTECIGLG